MEYFIPYFSHNLFFYLKITRNFFCLEFEEGTIGNFKCQGNEFSLRGIMENVFNSEIGLFLLKNNQFWYRYDCYFAVDNTKREDLPRFFYLFGPLVPDLLSVPHGPQLALWGPNLSLCSLRNPVNLAIYARSLGIVL